MMAPFTILVASSNSESRRYIESILVKLGLDAEGVSTLRECRENIAKTSFDLIFCDPHLVDGDYRELLSIHPDHMPLVVITSASASSQDFHDARQCGAFDVILSPPRPTDVEWMVIQARRHARDHIHSSPTHTRHHEFLTAAATH